MIAHEVKMFQNLAQKHKFGSGWLVGETDCRTLVEKKCVVMVEIGVVMVWLKWQHYQQT